MDTEYKPKRIRISEVAVNEGYESVEELLENCMDSIVPACCEDGCQVEPDGHCKHGHPLVLLAAGII